MALPKNNPVEEYLQMRTEQGGITAFENEKRAVQRFVRETLFAKVKFVTSDVDLEYSGKEKMMCVTRLC